MAHGTLQVVLPSAEQEPTMQIHRSVIALVVLCTCMTMIMMCYIGLQSTSPMRLSVSKISNTVPVIYNEWSGEGMDSNTQGVSNNIALPKIKNFPAWLAFYNHHQHESSKMSSSSREVPKKLSATTIMDGPHERPVRVLESNMRRGIRAMRAKQLKSRVRSAFHATHKKAGLPTGRCDGCFHWKSTTVLSPSRDLCQVSNGWHAVDLLILVTSVHMNRGHRDVMREVYHATQWAGKYNIRLLFAFGKDPFADTHAEELLSSESNRHHDIFQSAVIGTYGNLTRILFNAYEWVRTNCSNARFVIKITDDVILNVSGILHLIDVKGDSELYDVNSGQCVAFNPPKRSGKWSVTYKEYPFSFYPPWCSGAGSMMSLQLITELLSETENIAFALPLDDVNIGMNLRLTGNCVCDIPGLSFTSYNAEDFMQRLETGSCSQLFEMGIFMGAHLHGVEPEGLLRFWMHRECYEKMTPYAAIQMLRCPHKGTCRMSSPFL